MIPHCSACGCEAAAHVPDDEELRECGACPCQQFFSSELVPRIERGNGWTMYLGNCLGILPVLPPTDCVITDPPYGINDRPLEGTNGHATNTWHKPSTWDGSIDPAWCDMVGRAAPKVAWFGHWRKRPEVESAMPLPLRCEIVWAKDRHVGRPAPVAMRDERIWIFSEKGVVPQVHETSVWDEPGIPTWERKEHKNQKPIRLMRRLVEWFTVPGATVLDPFAGSGSTGVACLQLGRRFVGIEQDADHFAVACERLRAEESGTTLEASRAGQENLFKAG